MPELSRLIHVISQENQNLPAGTGILEIQKLRGNLVQAMFTGYDGRMWRGGMYSGTWTGWGGTDGVPAGSLSYYAGSTVPAGTVAELEALGARYEQTSWVRVGNLRGPGAIVGVLRSMAAVAAPGDVLVKLDADTALLDGDWLHWMADHPECLWYSSGDDRHLTYGCCYAVRAHVAVHLADVLQERHLPEDLTYALAMIQEYGREACRIEPPPGGRTKRRIPGGPAGAGTVPWPRPIYMPG